MAHRDSDGPKSSGELAGSAPLSLVQLIEVAPASIVSRILLRNEGGSLTLFAFDGGQSLSEHTAPFDALVQLVDGDLSVSVGGTSHRLVPGQLILMPAHVPHAVEAHAASRMLLTRAWV